MSQLDLRQLARGKPCQVRIPGVCNHDPETTVLAHIRRGMIAGVGIKPTDLMAVWACSDCHDVIDGRRMAHFQAEGDGSGSVEGSAAAIILDALGRTLSFVGKELGI